jgi:diguanylate cyclase (GGDEF)-like protein/hemerythrin-like metal-binding protein
MNDADLLHNFARDHVIRPSDLLSQLVPRATTVGIAVKGLDGRYRITNKVMESLFGRSAEEMDGLTDSDLFPPELAATLALSDQRVIGGQPVSFDTLRLLVSGQPRSCQWIKFPLRSTDGRVILIGLLVLASPQQDDETQKVESMAQLQQTIQDLQTTLIELDRLASTDKLTGAWNRRRLEEAAFNEMDRLRRYDHPLSLLIIDIDFFKQVNDQHGHSVGDQVLTRLAKLLQSSLRNSDSLTRWGGEEFVVLCPNTTLSTAAMMAERLREKVASASYPQQLAITASLGVAECIASETWDAWLERADAALYRAKSCGRNQVQIAPETPQRIGVGENVAANFVKLSWHSAYECGHPLIDRQHRGLFEHANQLLGAILSGRPADEVAALIEGLVRDVVQHFKDEEAIIHAANFPGAHEHSAIHRQLVDRAAVLVSRFKAGTLAIGELFQFLAHDVVARHMLGADREFFPFLDAGVQAGKGSE